MWESTWALSVVTCDCPQYHFHPIQPPMASRVISMISRARLGLLAVAETEEVAGLVTLMEGLCTQGWVGLIC